MRFNYYSFCRQGFRYKADMQKHKRECAKCQDIIAEICNRDERGTIVSRRIDTVDLIHVEPASCLWCGEQSINGANVVHADDCANR
jgi:hypothetical protein